MRDLTTNWNDAAYANATTFVDKGGAYVTIPANTPVNVRSMQDSVQGGDYAVLATDAVPATIVSDAADDELALNVDADDDVTITVAGSAADSVGVRVHAVSADPTVCTVSPAFAVTDANGEAVFNIVGIDDGVEDVTFSLASNPALAVAVEVTVTTPGG